MSVLGGQGRQKRGFPSSGIDEDFFVNGKHGDLDDTQEGGGGVNDGVHDASDRQVDWQRLRREGGVEGKFGACPRLLLRCVLRGETTAWTIPS